jgi:lipoate-protein ligase A
VTLFSHRSDYDRRRNLELVASALNRRWNTSLRVNERNDIICRDRWKVSGTSSKLGKYSTYHHFTLLLNAEIKNLKNSLHPHPELLMKESKATASRTSEVINLCSLYPTLNSERVCQAIAEDFYDAHEVSDSRQIVRVDPTSEDTLPGVTSLTEELKKWEWNFGGCRLGRGGMKQQISESQEFDSKAVDIVRWLDSLF